MNKTTIIIVAYDTIRLQRQITSACLGNISRYTNRDEYELIFVDQYLNGKSAGDLNTKFHHIDIDKHIKVEEHIGSSAAANLGAKNADPETKYLCFMHPDVFVWEGWLPTLRSFIEKGQIEIVMPHQSASDREQIKAFYQEENPRGNDDAGLIMMTKNAFEKSGGWDERLKSIYQDLAFRRRWKDSYWCTAKCLITHIGCGTLYAWTAEEERAAYSREAPIINST